MALTGQQRRTLRQIQRAPSFGKSKKADLALIMAGLVEKRLVHTPGGDRDSDGFLQQRPSQGWGPFRPNAAIDAEDFLSRALKQRGKSGSAGDLAADIQRPAAQYRGRYENERALAQEILGGMRRRGGGRDPGSPGLSGREPGADRTISTPAAPVLPQPQLEPLPELERPQMAPVSAPALPSFAAQAPGGMTVPSSGPPQPMQSKSALAEMLSASASAQVPERVGPPDVVIPGRPGRDAIAGREGAAGGRSGRLRDGGGWGGTEKLIQGAKQEAKRSGLPVTSEKRDRLKTASGNVSDHAKANKNAYATDIGTNGNDTGKGRALADRIARRYGGSYKPGQWNTWTVNIQGRKYRAQLGYGGGLDGHDDHVHFGLKRL